MEKVLHTKWGKAKILQGMDGGNVNCRYAYYGLNRLRCSRAGNEGNYCQYWKGCVDFEYCEFEID